jgi:Raf kinase inhibitor-like YbhB/YbcL family protein
MASDEFRLVSPPINHEGRLPRKYAWEGQGALKNLSPPLEWYNVPDGTKTLALVVQDIDAPDPSGPIVPGTIWVVVNIPPTVNRLAEGFSGKKEELGDEYAGIKEGHNNWKVPGWRGPKLPSHGHRFEFKLYALDDEMHLGNKVRKTRTIPLVKTVYWLSEY